MSDARERLIEAVRAMIRERPAIDVTAAQAGTYWVDKADVIVTELLAHRDDLLEALGGERVPWGTVRLGETTWRFPLMADDASLKSAARRLDAEWDRTHGRPT